MFQKKYTPLSLSLISSHTIDLKHVYSFTVMTSTGDVILWGEGPRRFLEGIRGNPCAFHIYNNTSAGWSKQKSVGALCKHSLINMLPVAIEQQGELLAVSCAECSKIRLYNITSGETKTAFTNNDDKKLGHMCHGEKGSMFVAYVQLPQDYKVLELGCTTTEFFSLKTYKTGISMRQEPPDISYIPTCKLIVVCSKRPSKMIRAIPHDHNEEPRTSLSSAEDAVDGPEGKANENAVTWQHRYAYHSELENAGKGCSPSAIHFSPKHDRLIVGDMLNGRLLVFNPEDGTHLQTIPVDSPGWVEQICPYDLKWFHTSPPNSISMLNRIFCGGVSSSNSKKTDTSISAPQNVKVKHCESGQYIAMWLDNPYSTNNKQTVSFFSLN